MPLTNLWALLAREVTRFRKLWLDTVFSPIVSVALYLSVFGIVVGTKIVGGVPYLTFVYSGLLSMMLINSSFSNPTFALILAKNVGTFIDLQLIPIKPWRIGSAYALAALTRGLVTLVIALAFTVWFVPDLHLFHPILLIFTICLTGFEFGLLGFVFGIRAKNFETLTFMTTFVMQPMVFLAGVFYPLSSLPQPWSRIAMFNPLHANVNVLRYAVTNYQDTSLVFSLVMMSAMTLFLFGIMNWITKKSLRA